jgi:membrane protein YdbS with pleckstrin-like domain
MKIVLFRFIIVWIVLHIILFFIESYRYKHSSWSWYGFKNEGMLNITYGILFIDTVGVIIAIILGLGYWILHPIIE